jgi:hypothetical protein
MSYTPSNIGTEIEDIDCRNDLLTWRKDLRLSAQGGLVRVVTKQSVFFFDEYEQIKKSLDLNITRRKVILTKTLLLFRIKSNFSDGVSQ